MKNKNIHLTRHLYTSNSYKDSTGYVGINIACQLNVLDTAPAVLIVHAINSVDVTEPIVIDTCPKSISILSDIVATTFGAALKEPSGNTIVTEPVSSVVILVPYLIIKEPVPAGPVGP